MIDKRAKLLLYVNKRSLLWYRCRSSKHMRTHVASRIATIARVQFLFVACMLPWAIRSRRCFPSILCAGLKFRVDRQSTRSRFDPGRGGKSDCGDVSNQWRSMFVSSLWPTVENHRIIITSWWCHHHHRQYRPSGSSASKWPQTELKIESKPD